MKRSSTSFPHAALAFPIYIASALALDLKLAARDLLPVQREKDAVDEMP